jgi:hypothetical protein
MQFFGRARGQIRRMLVWKYLAQPRNLHIDLAWVDGRARCTGGVVNLVRA